MATELIIACHPAVGYLIPPCVEHLQALRLARVIAHLRRDMACLASWLVVCPLCGQRQAEVEQGMIMARDVPHEDPDLAGVHLAPVPAPLALHPDRMRAPLGETAGIKRNDAIGFPQPLDDLTHQHAHQRAMIPGGGTDELLQDQALDVDQRRDVLGS